MGRRGPIAKPTRLKVLQGNPGKRRLNTAEPEPLEGEIYQPEDVAADSVAAEEWARICPMLKQLGIIGAQDYLVLSDICRIHARRVMAQAKINELGPMVKGSLGAPTMNPFIKLAQECERDLRQLYRTVGLDPSGRSALHVKPIEKKSGRFDKFKMA